MHISDLSLGNLGANGIVGGGMSIACGAAMSLGILKKNGGVVVCFFGEGASNEGVTHEAMNLAAIWKLPVIFLCENNLYQVFTSVEESLSVKDVSVRATAYGIPGVTVDGNDVFALEKALSPAIQRARIGDGPSLIEAKTYRWDGHYPGDGYFMGGYRSVEEVEAWKKRCPILFLEDFLLKKDIITREAIVEIKEQIHMEIDAAQKYAEDSPWPEEASLWEDVFSEEASAR